MANIETYANLKMMANVTIMDPIAGIDYGQAHNTGRTQIFFGQTKNHKPITRKRVSIKTTSQLQSDCQNDSQGNNDDPSQIVCPTSQAMFQKQWRISVANHSQPQNQADGKKDGLNILPNLI